MERKAVITARAGAATNTHLFAPAGTSSSLKKSLMPSATGCRMPMGPVRLGPRRNCMKASSRRSAQVITENRPSRAWNRTITLTTVMASSCWTGLRVTGGRSLRGRGVDHLTHLRDLVGRKPALLRVLPDHLHVGGDVHAVDLVVGDVARHPLDLRAQVLEHAARLLRDPLELFPGEPARAGQLPLDHVL